MTVVVGMVETSESMLLAADGEVTHADGLKSTKQKLIQVKNKPLAWASAGNPQIAYGEFAQWLDSYDWADNGWGQFIGEARRELSRLNGIQREMTLLSKAPLQENVHLTEVIIAGWLERPAMFALANDGRYFAMEEFGFASMGTGSHSAQAMYNVLAFSKAYNPENMMRMIMQVAISTAPNCGPPADCWRITRTGISPIFRFESMIQDVVVTRPPALQSGPGSNAP